MIPPVKIPRFATPLPQDIIIEILQRLPFIPVLRCKLVSKQWKNLINDPKFYKLYTHNSCTAFFLNKNDLYCLLISHDNNTKRIDGRNINIPPFTVHRIPIKLPNKRFHRPALLNSGSSNGIVYVEALNKHFLLYNLFTGASCAVKNVPMNQHSWLCCGFGYNRYADDYKILVVCDYAGPSMRSLQNKEKGLFWVYSFRNKGWNSFQDFPYAAYHWEFRHAPRACSFNGVLHWPLVTKPEKQKVIVTYDLHTSRFRQISVPSSVIYYDNFC